MIGSNRHEGEMFVHSAFPAAMPKAVYWMFVGALFRDSASRVLRHYRGLVEEVERDAEAVALKQIEEEENRQLYLENREELDREYRTLLEMNATRRRSSEGGFGGVEGDAGSAGGLRTLIDSWAAGGHQDPLPLGGWVDDDDDDGDGNGDGGYGFYPPSLSRDANGTLESLRNRVRGIEGTVSTKPKRWGEGALDALPWRQHDDNPGSPQSRRTLTRAERSDLKALERESRRIARQKARALKEAAKVVVDYRPVMSRIIDDYLFRCPGWHYAQLLTEHRERGTLLRRGGQQGSGIGSVGLDGGRGRNGNTKADNGGDDGIGDNDARKTTGNNVYVFRFSQPTHIPGYRECWGKSCHTAVSLS